MNISHTVFCLRNVIGSITGDVYVGSLVKLGPVGLSHCKVPFYFVINYYFMGGYFYFNIYFHRSLFYSD